MTYFTKMKRNCLRKQPTFLDATTGFPRKIIEKKKKKNSCGVTKCRLLSQARRKAIFDLPRPLPRELFGIGPLRIIPNPLIRRAGLFPRGAWSGGGITHQVT